MWSFERTPTAAATYAPDGSNIARNAWDEFVKSDDSIRSLKREEPESWNEQRATRMMILEQSARQMEAIMTLAVEFNNDLPFITQWIEAYRVDAEAERRAAARAYSEMYS